MNDSEQDRGKREQEVYEREQEMTALYRQTLKAIREDAEEAVARAVRSATPAPADWEGIVRRVVREEMASAAPPGTGGPVSASQGDADAKGNIGASGDAGAQGDAATQGNAGTKGDAAAQVKAGSRPWPTWAAAVVGALTAVALVGAGWFAGRQWGPWPDRAGGGGDGAPGGVGDPAVPLVDTLGAVLPDSLAVPDSLAQSDSLSLSDSLAQSDSLGPADSVGLAADSSQVPETDSASDAGPDSSGVEIRPEDVP